MSSTVLLALAAMRTSDTALATVQEGAIAVRNDRWLELAEPRGLPWRPAGDAHAREPGAGLEEAVLAEAAELLRTAARARASRWERVDGDRVLELRVERARLDGEAPLVLAMATDLTTQVRAERELARMRDALLTQERLRAIGEVASGVAHDLNNTLHALTLRLARLRAGPLSADQDGNVKVIERIAREATARVRRLQDLARSRDDVPLETVDLQGVVTETVAAARPELEGGAGERRVVVDVRLPRLPPAVGSASELHHVFLNLLLNARDAMSGSGRILVEGHADSERVVVAVADEGTGIPPDDLGRVFDPFFTTKGRRGTGLGLSLAAGVMRRLGGSIRAENRRGRGARFTLTFPVAAPAVPEQDPSPAPGSGDDLPMRRVLVVDDDEDNLDAARWLLEHLGQRAEVAGAGADALGRVEAGERYDVVLCDLGMPEMSGWEVVERLRARLPRARIYLVTGWAEQVPRDEPRRTFVDGVLPKPLAIAELHRILREADSGPVTEPARAASAPVPPPG